MAGAPGAGASNAEVFLNVDPRAFYDTSQACIQAMADLVAQLQFTGTVASSDYETKTVTARGPAAHLKEGVPLDVYPAAQVGEPAKSATVYVTRITRTGIEARWRGELAEGIGLAATLTNRDHRWVVAVGKIEDEVENHDELVRRFRDTLLEKMSEGNAFLAAEGASVDVLARLSNRATRVAAFNELFRRGVELVVEGKLYGSAGARRAHFKIYSTLSGRVIGEPTFETSL
jgi:hypothetical protein